MENRWWMTPNASEQREGRRKGYECFLLFHRGLSVITEQYSSVSLYRVRGIWHLGEEVDIGTLARCSFWPWLTVPVDRRVPPPEAWVLEIGGSGRIHSCISLTDRTSCLPVWDLFAQCHWWSWASNLCMQRLSKQSFPKCILKGCFLKQTVLIISNNRTEESTGQKVPRGKLALVSSKHSKSLPSYC